MQGMQRFFVKWQGISTEKHYCSKTYQMSLKQEASFMKASNLSRAAGALQQQLDIYVAICSCLVHASILSFATT
jgi:hypothetical protein